MKLQIGAIAETAIGGLEVELDASGEATVRVKKATGAMAFVFEYATEQPGPDTIWVREEKTSRTHTFKGLQRDKRHWFRTLAIGRKGRKAYCRLFQDRYSKRSLHILYSEPRRYRRVRFLLYF